MPFKSQAQRRKFAQLLVEGKISPDTYEEWNRETGAARLPERVKSKKAKRSRSKPAKARKASPARKAAKARKTAKRRNASTARTASKRRK
jgi:hypothetical protein